MTTAQIIITVITFLVIVITQINLMFTYYKVADIDKITNSYGLSIVYNTLCSWLCIIFIFVVHMLAQSKVNKLLSNNPCPKLEKLENVYKILNHK